MLGTMVLGTELLPTDGRSNAIIAVAIADTAFTSDRIAFPTTRSLEELCATVDFISYVRRKQIKVVAFGPAVPQWRIGPAVTTLRVP